MFMLLSKCSSSFAYDVARDQVSEGGTLAERERKNREMDGDGMSPYGEMGIKRAMNIVVNGKQVTRGEYLEKASKSVERLASKRS